MTVEGKRNWKLTLNSELCLLQDVRALFQKTRPEQGILFVSAEVYNTGRCGASPGT